MPEAAVAIYTLPESGGLHKTLVGATADRVEIPRRGRPREVEVTNRSSVEWLYVRADSTAATVGADGTTVVAPGSWVLLDVQPGDWLSLAGSGNPWSVAPSGAAGQPHA